MTDQRGPDLMASNDVTAADDVAAFDEELFEEDDNRTYPERACGYPAAHDRLLILLRRYHPEGHDSVADVRAPMSRAWPARIDTSLTGSSAGLCAELG